jgi:DNA replication initiation complex subunit (GINS family)
VLTREEKSRRSLHATIDDFRARVIPLLKAVSEGRNTGFFTTAQNNPWGKVSCSREGPEILSTATWIVEEAERLGEPEASVSAQKVVEAFRRANDLDPHSLGPIRLARQLLAEIGKPE